MGKAKAASQNESARRPRALRELPPFPAVATKVLQLLSKEDTSMRRIVDLIRTDPGFSAGILRVANSALFGVTSRIETVRHAVVVVGLDRVKALTLTVALSCYLQTALRFPVLRRCWRHSLACALLSEELAPACGHSADTAFTAGLLHDAGRLGLLVAHPAEYSNLLAIAEQTPSNILGVEEALFDTDHCQAGRWLMNEWQFPFEFHEVAARHHLDPVPGQSDLLLLVQLACRLADTLGFEVVKPDRIWTLQEIAAALPDAGRERFHPDPEALRVRLASIIGSLD